MHVQHLIFMPPVNNVKPWVLRVGRVIRKAIENPDYLFPDVNFRANMMKRIKKHFKVLANAVDDPFQRTLLEFQAIN